MKQEEKELLLKDLCARLPYGVKCQIDIGDADVYVDTLATITIDGCVSFIETIDTEDVLEYGDIKPLLFPLLSMTEEQKEEYCSLQQKVIYNSKGLINSDVMEYVNWCYKNHIDINNLIPMGLANDATGLDIYGKL